MFPESKSPVVTIQISPRSWGEEDEVYLKSTLHDTVLFKWQQSKLTISYIDALHAETSALGLQTLHRLWKDSNTPFRKYLKG